MRSEVKDAGLATVWAAGLIAVVLMLAGAVYSLGAAVIARHRVSAAADLSALAAAGGAMSGELEACSRAGLVAGRWGARLRECRLEQWDALVEISLDLPGVLDRLPPVSGRARAGPG